MREYKRKERLTEAGKERNRRSSNKWRQKNCHGVTLKLAASRAKNRGIEFTITEADIVWPAYCPVLGTELVYGGGRKDLYVLPSLDRVDNSKGYIPGNVRVISYRANWLKSNGTAEEFERVLAYIREG